MMMATETTKSRDLLRRFAGTVGGDGPSPMSVADGGGEVELSLGLSLNGCFGVDKNKKGLVRSSSVTTFSMLPVENDGCGSELGLTRTCSLPTEMEEERRKRTEIQSLKRRMEAKRKRTEKQQSRAATATATVKAENLNLNLNLNLDEEKKKADVVNGPANWAVVGYGGTKPISQGSIGSQGSSCSGVSDFDSHPMQQARSPSTRPPLADQPPNLLHGKPRNHSREEEEDEGRMKRNCTNAKSNGVKEMERNMMEEMPCVSTRGDGPNGRRIEGFLYKYRSGDEVRIVCVCCGKFLTPAEFVKHAGGGDVDNPLRHIVVNSAPAAFV